MRHKHLLIKRGKLQMGLFAGHVDKGLASRIQKERQQEDNPNGRKAEWMLLWRRCTRAGKRTRAAPHPESLGKGG